MGTAVSVYAYNTKSVLTLGYLAQLQFLDRGLLQRERFLLHHILHSAQSSFTVAATFNLQKYGGPKIISIQAMSLAALCRSALTTVTGWQEQWLELQDTGEEHLAWLRARSSPWPKWWDTPAFVDNLWQASNGFPNKKNLSAAVLEAKAEAQKLIAKADPDQKVRVQHIFYDKIHKALFKDDFEAVVRKRLRVIIPGHLACSAPVNLDQAFQALRSQPGHARMVIIRSWCNSWTTVARFHDPEEIGCIFGCRAMPDALVHYCTCPRLWRVARHQTKDQISIKDPMVNLGLSADHAKAQRRLYIASATYHALRLKHFERVKKLRAQDAVEELALLAKSLAELASRQYGLSKKFINNNIEPASFTHNIAATASSRTTSEPPLPAPACPLSPGME